MRALGLVLFLTLAGCVSDRAAAPVVAQVESPDPAVIKAERAATTRAYVVCLMRNARDLDDRRSDPGSIATGVLSACSSEFNTNIEAHSRYLEDGLEGRRKVAQIAHQGAYATATELVLKHRNGTLVVPR